MIAYDFRPYHWTADFHAVTGSRGLLPLASLAERGDLARSTENSRFLAVKDALRRPEPSAPAAKGAAVGPTATFFPPDSPGFVKSLPTITTG